LPDLPPREPFAAGDVVKAWLIFCEEFPGGASSDFGMYRAAKFVLEEA